MKPCSENERELAACAAGADELSPALAKHLQHCDQCRTAFVELQRAAAIQFQMAANLPAPVHRPQLAFIAQPDRHPLVTGVTRSKPLMAMLQPRPAIFPLALLGTALLLAAFCALLYRTGLSPNQPSAEPSLANAAPVIEKPSVAVDPTWQALREELQNDDDALEGLYRGSGNLVNHYRVKDAYFGRN